MILESLRPESVHVLCQALEQQLGDLDNQIAQADYALMGELDPARRQHLETLRARETRRAAALRARLLALKSARYSDNQQAVWSRTARVA